MILIGISGKKRTGKDEVGRIITELSSKPVYKIAFADALKEEVARACGVTVQYIEQNKDQFRVILQWWGTDFRRKQDDQYWLKAWAKRGLALPDDCICIVPDVRFHNEADYVSWLGGYLFRVHREGLPLDTHKSETDLDKYTFDNIIENNSSLTSLRESVKQLLTKLQIK